MGNDYFATNLPAQDENATLILNDMKEAIKRADLIILGLLDFSVPAGLDVHPHSLGAVVEESVALVRHEMAAHRIRLHTELSPQVPPVWIDRNKIKQVLVNVMTNAIQP